MIVGREMQYVMICIIKYSIRNHYFLPKLFFYFYTHIYIIQSIYLHVYAQSDKAFISLYHIGVDGFLPKPFSLDDLIAAIAEVEKTVTKSP